MYMKSNVSAESLLEFDTPEKAYILGYLWGDGSISKKSGCVSLELVKDDLDKIRNIFDTVGRWTYSTRKRAGRRPQATLKCTNQLLFTELSKRDYTEKSLKSPDKILSEIPDQYKPYFIRGLFDADGCFYVNKKNYLKQVSISGSYNQDWASLELLFNQLKINYQIQRRVQKRKDGLSDTSSSVIRFQGRDNIELFGKYIYQDRLDLGLERKYEKYLEALEVRST